jgi:hypothetical protein
VVTGNLANNLGRYGLDDNHHTNGYFNLQSILADQCLLQSHLQPITAECLAACDVLVIVNPDYPGYPGHTPPYDDREIAAIHGFVARGGGLLLMINSFLPEEGAYLWKENYDIEAVNRILLPYGLAGGHHVSGNSEICHIAADDPVFGGLGPVEYGHGGQIHVTPVPGTTHRSHFGNQGRHYCVSARTPGGTVFVLADAGFMSNGLVTVPWADNLAFVQRMFLALRPAWLESEGPSTYEVTDLELVAYPHEARLDQTHFKELNPSCTPEPAHNYHYISQERRAWLEADRLTLPADLLAVAQGREARVALSLLSCELFGSALTLDIPLTVVGAVPNGALLDVHVVGHAALPHVSLANACRTRIPAFAREIVQGGMQSLRWHFRLNQKNGRLTYSRMKLFAEPAWKDDRGTERCVNLGRTQLIAPSLPSARMAASAVR